MQIEPNFLQQAFIGTSGLLGDLGSGIPFVLIGPSPLSVYAKKTKQGIRWYYQIMVDGEYHRGGGYPTKREAKEKGTEERRSSSSTRTVMAFWSLTQKYLDYILARKQSPRWYREKKNFFKKRCQTFYETPIDRITRSDIEQIILRRAESSPYMANKELKFLNAIFNYAVQQEWLNKNPCHGIQRVGAEKHIRSIPTLADFNKVLLAAEPVEQRLLALVFLTLARQTEILDLKQSDDHGDYIILRSKKHKGGAIREDKVAIGSKARMALDWLKKNATLNPGDFLFVNRKTGTRYTRRPKLMRSLSKKAGVKPFGFHDIRALGASVMAKDGVPIKYISGRLRHLKISTTEIYLHSIGEGEIKATEVLEKAL